MLGRTVSHYRVAERLGGGGMGVVYKAVDTRLKRSVALKFLHERHLSDPNALERFRREAFAVSSLNHPNICVIHDIDEYEGQPYIVMEYLEGETLKDHIDNGPIETEKLLDYGIQITEGLREAHSKGIIHRDLKPSNVMITPSGHAKILDFGLAKLISWPKASSEDSLTPTIDNSITDKGTLLGTPSYMSPEQVLGKEVDQRSDLFSLGVLLYEMASGILPFRGETFAAFCAELIHKSPISVLRLNPSLPEEFDGMFSRALEKEPKYRYQSAPDLHAELSHLKHQIEISVTPTPAPRPVHPGLVTKKAVRYGLLVLLALVLLFPTTRRAMMDFFGFGVSPSAQYLAVLPFEILGEHDETQRAFCDGLAIQITHVLVVSERYQGRLRVIPFLDMNGKGVRTPSEAQKEFGVDLAVQATAELSGDQVTLALSLVDTKPIDTDKSAHIIDVREVLGDVKNGRALRDQAITVLEPMLRVSLRLEGTGVLAQGVPAVETAYGHLMTAEGYLLRHDKPENLEKAREALLRSLDLDPNYALAHAKLGETYRLKYRELREPRWIVMAEDEVERAIELDRELDSSYVVLGYVYSERGRYEEARIQFDVAKELDIRNADAYRGAANAREKLGDLEGAESEYRAAIRLKPNYWMSHYELAQFYRRQNRHEDARKEYSIMLDLIPDSAAAYNNVAGSYLDLQEWEEAERLLKIAIEMEPTADEYNNLARVYFFTGRLDEALGAWEKALEFGDNDHLILQGIGFAYEQAGKKEEAMKYYAEAAQNAEQELRVNPRDPELKADLAHYLSRLGEEERAIRLMSEALEVLPNNPWILAAAGAMYERLGHRELAIEKVLQSIQNGYALAELKAWPTFSDLFQDQGFLHRLEIIEQEESAGEE